MASLSPEAVKAVTLRWSGRFVGKDASLERTLRSCGRFVGADARFVRTLGWRGHSVRADASFVRTLCWSGRSVHADRADAPFASFVRSLRLCGRFVRADAQLARTPSWRGRLVGADALLERTLRSCGRSDRQNKTNRIRGREGRREGGREIERDSTRDRTMKQESEKEKERVYSRVSVLQQSRSVGIPETGMGRKQLTCSKCSQHTHQPETSQMLVEYKKCNASSWNPQVAALTALLAVSVAQNSKCVGLGIPRWHCVQGAAGTGVCCSKHS